MSQIKMTIECPSCKGTGIYQGIGEGQGTAVVCHSCKGTGAYKYFYQYNKFVKRKIKEGVKRVYLTGTQYKIGLGKINFSNGIGKIDMDKEGVSYQDFLNGEKPKHIKKLGCPMLLDQGECHNIKGFTDECNRLNGGWINIISDCKNWNNKSVCWERFEK